MQRWTVVLQLNSMKKSLLTFAIFLLTFTARHAYGQSYSIYVYDVPSQTLDSIQSVPLDTTTTFDKTPSSIGILGNQVPLSLTPPTINLFSGSNFSDIERAALFFNVTDYPIRTAVKLFGWNNDTLKHNCSGIMIAEDLVLTAGHCVQNLSDQNWRYDSILVLPAYDDSTIQPTLPTSIVKKYYVFKSFYYHTGGDDIAILQLQKPIGQQTGWIGIAFTSDTGYFNGKVFHKLSYPKVPGIFDTTKIYNGDTLYYNYGFIDVLPPKHLGIISSEALAIPGQSGSSFFYTDNSEYYSFGVCVYSGYYRHTQIDRNIFYQFKNVIENYTNASHDILSEKNTINIFPNPFSSQTVLRTDIFLHNATFTVYNRFGQTVAQIKNIIGQTITFNRGNLASGLYFVRLTEENNPDSRGIAVNKLVITD